MHYPTEFDYLQSGLTGTQRPSVPTKYLFEHLIHIFPLYWRQFKSDLTTDPVLLAEPPP